MGTAGSFPKGGGRDLPGCEANRTPPSSAEVKNMWSYTSTLLYDFMACIEATLPWPSPWPLHGWWILRKIRSDGSGSSHDLIGLKRAKDVTTETDLEQTRTGQIPNTSQVCYCSITGHGFTARPSRQRTGCVELGTTRSLQRCPYSNNNNVEKRPPGHNTEQMKRGRTEEKQICWVTDLCFIRCEATLFLILTVQSISVGFLNAASRNFLSVVGLLCSVTMHSLFYEKRTECGTDGSKFKTNSTPEPEITVCKQHYQMELAVASCT
jgi:hypothetical protein